MPRFMLDTDICSYVLKRSNPAVLKQLQGVALEDVCISSITKAELLYGVEISPRKQTDGIAVDAFLRHIEVLDFPADAAAHYADIRADLKRRGAMIGAHDLFIAAHARARNMTLVTNNIREFRRVRGLVVENWARSGAP
jgi:tRNA(fMet)-specific endonuclease VapC